MSRQQPSPNFLIPSPEHHGRKRPASKSKILANRRNSLMSTGPRTSVGKSNSRRNAINHGLFTRVLFADLLVKREDPEEFRKIHAELRDVWHPCGRAEELEIEHIAVCWWKRARLWRYENGEMRVALDLVAIRGQVSSPGELVIEKDKSLILLLESAQKQIETAGEMQPELKEKILASASWLRQLWPELEEKAEQIVREDDERIANSLAQKIGLTLIAAKEFLESSPENAAARAQLTAVLPTKLAIREILRWSQEQYQYVLDGAYDQQAIPKSDSLDRILRYSAMIDRDLNRAYDRLERLQRRRKGELVPPSLNLNVSV
jgi:hypothetical protein